MTLDALRPALDSNIEDVLLKLTKGKFVSVGSRDPKAVGERFITHANDARQVVRFYQGLPYRYVADEGRYLEQNRDDFASEVLRFTQALYVEQSAAFRELIPEQFRPQIRPRPIAGPFLADCIATIKAHTTVSADQQLPVWLGEGQPGRLLSMRNGVIDLDCLIRTGRTKLRPHTPDFFTVSALPFDYDPKATCPQWATFLAEVLEGDRERNHVLQEWFGYCLVPATQMQKFLLMEGGGSNGKSVTIDILTNMLGTGNVSSVPLETFDGRFALAPTHGKLLNVCNEWTMLKPRVEGIVKQYVGGDLLTADRKNLSALQFRPTARILITTNNRPQIADRSEGMWRRMLALPFRVHIPEDRQDKYLADKLRGELSGIFNWSIIGLRRLLEHDRFTESAVSKSTIDVFRIEDDPVRDFCQSHLVLQPHGITPKAEVYARYVDWCGKQGEVAMTQREFGKRLRGIFSGITNAHTKRNKRDVEAYKGVQLVALH